jgi:hypothetical protein
MIPVPIQDMKETARPIVNDRPKSFDSAAQINAYIGV